MRVVDPKAHQKRIWCIERAALRLFASRGYSETSLDQVAFACRMRKASLYHYFRNKEALLHGVIEAMVRKIHSRMLGRKMDPRNMEESLYRVGMGFLDDISTPDHRDFMQILMRDAGNKSYLRRTFFKVAHRTMGDARAALEKPRIWRGGRMSGREHLMYMHQFLGCLFRYGTEARIWKAGPALAFGDRAYVRSLARIFARGIGA